MRKARKVKVNYLSSWNNDGTHYNQTITLNKVFIKYINKLIKHYHNSDYENKCIIADRIGFSTYYDCYLTEIDTKKDYEFLTLTQLSFIYYYLSINNYDVKRILRRNTLLKITDKRSKNGNN